MDRIVLAPVQSDFLQDLEHPALPAHRLPFFIIFLKCYLFHHCLCTFLIQLVKNRPSICVEGPIYIVTQGRQQQSQSLHHQK